MLIYEKIVNGVRHLFGTNGNIPADTDSQLVYKDTDGDTLTMLENDSYVDDGHGGIIRKSDDKFVGVFIGDAQKAVIPNGWEPETKVIKSIKIKTKPTKVQYSVGEQLDLAGMVVEATYKDGDKVVVTTYTTNPENGAILETSGEHEVIVTFEEKTASFKVTVA